MMGGSYVRGSALAAGTSIDQSTVVWLEGAPSHPRPAASLRRRRPVPHRTPRTYRAVITSGRRLIPDLIDPVLTGLVERARLAACWLTASSFRTARCTRSLIAYSFRTARPNRSLTASSFRTTRRTGPLPTRCRQSAPTRTVS